MAPKDILREVRRTPFQPFALVLADGARYDIQHPDQCMVMAREVLIGEVADDSTPFIDWTIKINSFNVVRIERAAELAAV
ncbi:MAG TPA: hypothetical protein VMZ71_16645 [Gemmataceae bacterium]|nr:hypothetical protein [Gemmataceae bacterium]